jgi:hypothetical protein
VTVNNLLGLCFAILLFWHILETRELSFLRVRQFQILALIGVVLLIVTAYAGVLFPLLQASRTSLAKAKALDRTDAMTHDFVTRLVFLVFMSVFIRTRRDIRIVYLTFMIALYAAVPSALGNWLSGNLARGFRAAAAVTMGANPNKLAMICLMEVTCWWFWARSRAGTLRRVVGLSAAGAAVLVLMVTGSRSGLLGAGVLMLLLQTGPRTFRVSPVQIGFLGGLGALAVVTLVPAQTFTRMITLSPERGEVGATSNQKREDTIVTGLLMFRDHPLTGIGLGNFREVSRQIYGDKFYRPPHNSPLWAGAEGGSVVLGLYVLLFWVTWRDLQRIVELAPRDMEIAHIGAALRVVFLLLCFFSMFADLWLTTITYMLIGQTVVIRRYLESLPAVVPAAAVAPRRAVPAAA